MKIINYEKFLYTNTVRISEESLNKKNNLTPFKENSIESIIQESLSNNTNQDWLFQKFKDKFDELGIFDDITLKEIDFYSFINFLRYYKYLHQYLKLFHFQKNIDKKILSINFESGNNIGTNLQLTFHSDGITSFLSLDRDINEEIEFQSYIIEGNFSSSSLVSKSYKIRNLLSILDSSLHHCKFNSKSTLENINITEKTTNLLNSIG